MIGSALAEAVMAFAVFCCASSFVYVVNDICDVERDRTHPLKRERPIASGRISIGQAVGMACFCLLGAALSFFMGRDVAALIGAYLILNLGYSLWLKNILLLDVMLISCGFIFRVLVGTKAIHVPASAWILLCTFFLSLFLGFGKRRAELDLLQEESGRSRGLLSEYSVTMLDRFCNIFATLSIASYALFTLTSRPDHSLLITCPPVVFGLLRYLYLIENHGGESPDLILLTDRPLQTAIAIWGGISLLILYAGLRMNFL